MRKAALQIGTPTRERMVETGEEFLNVPVTLIYMVAQDGSELTPDKFEAVKDANGNVVVRNFSYPVTTDRQTIVDDLKKFVNLYNEEAVQKEANKEKDALDQKVTTLIGELEKGVIQ